MVVERRNFQRVYDLTHRVMPHWDDTRDLLSQDAAEAIMLGNSALQPGIFRPQWLADYYRLRQPQLKPLLETWQREQRVMPVSVESLGEMWLHADLFPAGAGARGQTPATHSAVLSPFDPVVWDRKRAEQLFDFSYRLECYTRRKNVSTVILFCRCFIKGSLSGAWTLKCTVKPARLKLSRSGWKRA
ncbi:MAG: DNA glycosylase AlkZ-like family protein [Enterobacter hormaechei]